jgi:uncharacterized protein (TIGR00369 family)
MLNKDKLKKINNPFLDHKGDEYNCFGCSPANELGLLMEFYSDGISVFSEWDPQNRFEGYHNVVHGGIQATIMDEIASWTVYSLLDTAGVTEKMEVNYHKPLYISKGKITIESEVSLSNSKQAIMSVSIKNAKGIVCSSAKVVYFLFPPKLAKLKYNYPGKDAFWK